MNKKTLIERVKALFNETPTKAEVKFVDVKTQDGKILRTDSIEAGMKIVEIDETGEVALENATYVLEDGTSLVVEDSLIKEVIPAVVEEEAPVEEEFSNEVVEIAEKALAQFAVMMNEFKTIKESFEAEKVEKEALKAELEVVKTNFAAVETVNKDLVVKFEKFSKAPSADSTQTFIDAKKATREERLKEFSKR